MDEREWTECADLTPMLGFLRDRASDRKLRLFAVGCCRSVRGCLWTKSSYPAVLMAERYADSLAEPAELDDARMRVESSLELYGDEPVYDAAFWACGRDIKEDVGKCARYATSCATLEADQAASDFDARCAAIMTRERYRQARLLDDIFGNPFRPVALSPAWRSSAVRSLAQAAYDTRTLPEGMMETDRLAVLADALEDVGCADADILGHLRGPGPHVRGCWAVDLILNKE